MTRCTVRPVIGVAGRTDAGADEAGGGNNPGTRMFRVRPAT
jgi:hypothetical protein